MKHNHSEQWDLKETPCPARSSGLEGKQWAQRRKLAAQQRQERPHLSQVPIDTKKPEETKALEAPREGRFPTCTEGDRNDREWDALPVDVHTPEPVEELRNEQCFNS